jgi:hypothetical protein
MAHTIEHKADRVQTWVTAADACRFIEIIALLGRIRDLQYKSHGNL